MFIKEITSQHRRDFQAVYACEHCGNEYCGGGYDDSNFHQNVVPGMKCPECKKTADKNSPAARATRYPDGARV